MSEEAGEVFGVFHRRGHWQRHRGWGPRRGFPFEAFGAEWGQHWGPFGRGGPRVDRGDVKLLVLSVLRDGPKHGYEVMRAIEQRTGSSYTPSPGVIYPTLQLLEDMGHIQAREGGERKVYELTEAGRAYLDQNRQAERDAWSQFEGQPWQGLFPNLGNFGTEEGRQLRDELIELGRVLFAGGRIFRAEPAQLTRVRDALRTARLQIEAAFQEYV